MGTKSVSSKKPPRPQKKRDVGVAPAPPGRGPRAVSRSDRIEAYREVFSTAAGQIVWQDLLQNFGYTQDSTFPQGGNLGYMALREGQRLVTVHIGRQIAGNPVDRDNEQKEHPDYDPQ